MQYSTQREPVSNDFPGNHNLRQHICMSNYNTCNAALLLGVVCYNTPVVAIPLPPSAAAFRIGIFTFSLNGCLLRGET